MLLSWGQGIVPVGTTSSYVAVLFLLFAKNICFGSFLFAGLFLFGLWDYLGTLNAFLSRFFPPSGTAGRALPKQN